MRTRRGNAFCLVFFVLVMACSCKKREHAETAKLAAPSAVALHDALPATSADSGVADASSFGMGEYVDARSGVCASLKLFQVRLVRDEYDVFTLTGPDGPLDRYHDDYEGDLNGDGHPDLALHMIEGCSRSGGCMTYIFANCGDGTYGEVAALGYAKDVELHPKGRTRHGWRDLWLVSGDRDPRRPDCYLEMRILLRWTGETYEETKTVKRTRKC